MLKVAILDNNAMYLKRLQDYWSRTYGASALMVYAFSERERLTEQMERERFHILMVNSGMEMDWDSVPSDVMKVCLLAGRKDGEVNGIPALAKNGSADELYEKMLALYREHVKAGKEALPGKLVFFTSGEGGCGTSSCAVGYGRYLAAGGRKALYLNLELVSAQEAMLDGESPKSMEDLFYLCETSRKNVDCSVKTLATKDSCGLWHIAPCRSPLELQEKSGGDIRRLLEMVTMEGAFDVVVVDRGFCLDEITDALMDMADGVVLVSGADECGRHKRERTMALLEEMNHRGFGLAIKLKLLLNKGEAQGLAGSEGTGISEGTDMPEAAIPEWKGCSAREVTERMGAWPGFDRLLQI